VLCCVSLLVSWVRTVVSHQWIVRVWSSLWTVTHQTISART